MRQVLTTLSVMLLTLGLVCPAMGEVSVIVNPDNTVHVKKGYDLQQVLATDDASTYDATEASRVTVRFPEESPAVYELESEEDYAFIVDGWLPSGADVLMQAESKISGEFIPEFEHIITGGDWLIDADYMAILPRGEVEIYATLRTPGRRDVVVSHKFYILEPGALDDSENPVYDWEFEEDPNQDRGPIIPGEGFMTFTPPAGARVYYVSESGSDHNDGLSPSSPLRTCRAGYEKVRDGSNDWILLKAGDTFDGGFGYWGKAGKSADEPLHVGVYGDGDRPKVLTNGEGLASGYGKIANLRFDGIYAFANERIDAGSDITWNEGGFKMFGSGYNVVFHDCKLEGFKFNFVFQANKPGAIHDILLYRCISNNAFGHWDGAIAGHSSGLYAQNVERLNVIGCTFDRNGWNPTVGGAIRTKFNHGLYVQFDCYDVNVVDSIITRSSSHGLQLRPGGNVQNSLFYRNALGFFVAIHPSLVMDNVVMESDDLSSSELRGQGFMTLPVEQASITGNIVANKKGAGGHVPGIALNWEGNSAERIDSYDVVMEDNVIWNWQMDGNYKPFQKDGSARASTRNTAVDGRVYETGRTVSYNNPNADMSSYISGGLEEFLKGAVLRRRGEWDETFTADGFNSYMREAFSTGSF